MRITEAHIRKVIREELVKVLEVQDPTVVKSFLGLGGEKKKPLATFKLEKLLKTAVPPTNDKDKEDLSSFISSLNIELKRLGAKSGSQALGMLQADKELDANIVKEEGKYYVKNKKYNILIGDREQVVDFARITGIQVNDLPKETSVYAGLPPKGTEMGALTNKLQGETYGLGKGFRENKRK